MELQFRRTRICRGVHRSACNDMRNNGEQLLSSDLGSSYPPAFKHEISISGSLRPAQPDQPVVLVADDDIAIRNIVRFTLEEAGISC